MTITPSRRSGRRATGFDGTYEVLGDVQLSKDEEAEIHRQMAALEEDTSVPVSTALRWGKAQLDVVRRAAALAGVPYQTYLKEAAFRRAMEDLRLAREAHVEIP